ncbi:putative LuxR family transcriptional regulator [Gordonia paraffinivorans NBRC 108238]|uniref:LuxR family transcriptional regulator n=1 Tax=Gordonia paraffinivorans NBRC 108238 TaxID=1223543 RepID=A0ABQ0IM37_9ACTN|nr:helix-turn-helix transcriptional regulator [Gordonia paraffinivorans]GAC84613.1 putative LuxR family transcriptional regulator [Gordonia paraffinivorans NBRC 108238]
MSAADDPSLQQLRRTIDERLSRIATAGEPAGPDTSRELADLIEEYDRRFAGQSAAMRRMISETEAAIATLSRATDSETVLQSVRAGAAEIAGTAVRLVEHDPPPAELLLPIRLGDATVATLVVEDRVDPVVEGALVSMAELAGLLLETAAWQGREARQLELLDAAGGLGRSGLADAEPAPAGVAGRAPSALTRREAEIHQLLLTGAGNRDIAEELFVSVETVRSHVKRILHKLGARNRAELIARSD